MSADLIDHRERQGRLVYRCGYELREHYGWVRLSVRGAIVEGRRIRGSNRWGICSLDEVVLFEEKKKGE